jgi:catechol 2,3-dioxygenase-like lactoylglutathione lyase family enzyme
MYPLNLLVLRCRDLDASRTFYEALGCSFVSHRHGSGPVHYAHETDDFVLELYPAPTPDYADKTGFGFSTNQIWHLREILADSGLAPGPIEHRPWGVTFVIRDPDGRRIEIKWRSK